jgi:hypothetical protein
MRNAAEEVREVGVDDVPVSAEQQFVAVASSVAVLGVLDLAKLVIAQRRSSRKRTA